MKTPARARAGAWARAGLIQGGRFTNLDIGQVQDSPIPSGDGLAYVSTPPDGPPAILRLSSIAAGQAQAVAVSGPTVLDHSDVSIGEPIRFPTGEGGIVTTDDRELYELVKSMRAHGWVRDLPADSIIYEQRDDDFYEAYRFILPGYNVRPTDLSGAVGIEQLKKLPAMTRARRKNWALFRERFAGDNRRSGWVKRRCAVLGPVVGAVLA